MLVDYKDIVERNHNGETLKCIWKDLNIPVKYETFERAVLYFKQTGKERKLKVNPDMIYINMSFDDIKPKEIINRTKEEVLDILLKKGECTLSDISDDKDMAYSIIDDIRNDGYLIDSFNGEVFQLSKNIKPEVKQVVQEWNGCKHIRIGVVSDTHIGNVCTQMSFLHRLYEKFKELGISDVYHCGDISDGWYPNRSDQIYELFAHGADRQVKYICENYPKIPGITTHFITGNHDYTFVRNTGYNIGPVIAMMRDDMKYLGHNNVRVWLTPNCDMELNHPADGASYAMSYSIQKYIDSMSGGDKPKILLNGHHHKFLTMFYRNIHAIEVPCTEAQTPFMKSKRLAAHTGGLVLDIDVNEEGTIERFSVEMIPLYKTLENDY